MNDLQNKAFEAGLSLGTSVLEDAVEQFSEDGDAQQLVDSTLPVAIVNLTAAAMMMAEPVEGAPVLEESLVAEEAAVAQRPVPPSDVILEQMTMQTKWQQHQNRLQLNPKPLEPPPTVPEIAGMGFEGVTPTALPPEGFSTGLAAIEPVVEIALNTGTTGPVGVAEPTPPPNPSTPPPIAPRGLPETVPPDTPQVPEVVAPNNTGVPDTTTVPPSKGSLPPWLKERFEAGEAFNKANRGRYPHNEVEVTVKGEKFRVDSLDPTKGEIVSRRLTQLSDVKEQTAISYFNEFTRKYPAGAEITDSPFNPKVLRGKQLTGELIFEVPVQKNSIPQAVLDAATQRNIKIRDINGKVYNP